MISLNFFYKLRYLIIQNTSIIIIWKYVLNRLNHPLIKYFKKKEKLKFLKCLKKKEITQDYFSINSYYWKKIINKNFKNFSYLEIGTFEGSSILFVLKNFLIKEAICVDVWEDEENFKRFLSNCNEYKDKFRYFKKTSNNFFLNNKDTFDIIYIDGSHAKSQVLDDIENSWKILNKNGVIICDDFFYGNIYQKVNKDIPIEAVNIFFEINKKKIKVLCVNNNQIFLQKIQE
tara:strand:+ start:454 stop:1146 length:693 start_codon:yes stop_codon:yes gene_type:complete